MHDRPKVKSNWFLIKAIKTEDEIYVPIWEFHTSSESVNFLCHKKDYETYLTSYVVDVFYNIDTKEIKLGEDIIFNRKSEHKAEDEIMILHRTNFLVKDRIKEICWVFDSNYSKLGKDIKPYYTQYFPKDFIIDDNKLYNIKVFSPIYLTYNSTEPYNESRIYKLIDL